MATSKKGTPKKAAPAKSVSKKPTPAAKPAVSVTKSNSPSPTFNIDEIKSLIEAVQASNINELKLEKGDFKVKISHGTATVHVAAAAPVHVAAPASVAASAPAPATAPAAAPAPAPTADNLITIKSPMIGTFYRSAGPGKPTFVNVGDDIKAGQVLCIVEAMKLFNEIESEISGKIVKVLVDDATSVEYDQPLFLVQP
ncbi:MAG: acetyl-CoA carboxylase biotin carboxyl carrier protein [Chitinophagaceae bacterium]